jgi:thioesterase domain-containing protein
MTAAELETYLHEHIPLSRAMAVHVVSVADDQVILGAPLAPNINHRDTIFGGSAAAVATLAAWSLLHLRLTSADLPSRIVIQHSVMDYLAPMAADFTARATLAPSADWDGFIRLLTRRGRARIALQAELICEEQKGGMLHGDFVAFGKDRL